MKPDQERVHALLADTVTLLCKNGLNFQKGLKVEGIIGITVDEKDIFIVHINEVLQNETADKVQDVDATDEAVSVTNGSQPETAPRKHRRNHSGNSHENKPLSDDARTELPTRVGFSDLTPDGSCLYSNAAELDSAAYDEELLKVEKMNDDEVIFVKTEDSEFAEGPYEDPVVMGVAPAYVSQNVESLVPSEPQIPVSRTQLGISKSVPRHPQPSSPVQRLKASTVPQFAYPQTSNSALDGDFKYETKDDPNSSGDCEPSDSNNLSFATWSNASYTTSTVGTFNPRHHPYPRNQNSSGLAVNVPRRSDGNLWQVVSRFICNFPNCTLSFSTKQNLLRHQTQKHGRQKSRIVGHTRRFLEQTAGLSDTMWQSDI